MSREVVNRLSEHLRGSERLCHELRTVSLTTKLFVTEIRKNILGVEAPLEALGGGVRRCFVLLPFWVSVFLVGGIEDVLVPMNSVPR